MALSQQDPTAPAFMEAQPLNLTNYKVDIDTPPGAQIRYTGDGMAVYMRFDRPGIYLNDHGKRIPDGVAAMAGYDVELLAQERKLNEAKAQVLADLDQQHGQRTARKVIAHADDYSVVQVAPGYFNIEFEGGYVLNTKGPVSKDDAMRLFKKLTGAEEAAEAATSPAPTDVSQPTPGGEGKAAPRRA